MIYTITFNPAVDYVVTADTFRTGKTNRTKTENIVFGGKGVNVSLLLHALHTKSIALGFIAGFTGKALREGVEKEGITTDFIEVENGFTRINLKLHAEEETELNGSGPEISENELKKFFEKNPKIFGVFFKRQYCPAKRGKHHQLSNEKGGENVEPNRREFIKQCAFQKFCNTVLHNEACDAHKELHRHKAREITFSDLTLEEARQLHTFDEYFKGEIAFERAGKKITPKLLLEAIRTLPEEKRKAVLLYYFEGMNDTEIAELFDTSRSTIQYRRTSSFELLKKYLEENADEWDEW